jgi:hypothetical protein
VLIRDRDTFTSGCQLVSSSGFPAGQGEGMSLFLCIPFSPALLLLPLCTNSLKRGNLTPSLNEHPVLEKRAEQS